MIVLPDGPGPDRETMPVLVSAAHDGIVSCGTDGTIQTWNNGATRMFGATAQDMIGTSLFRLVPESLTAAMRENFAHVAAGSTVNFDMRLQLPPTPGVDVSAGLVPIRHGTGGILAIVVVMHDITRRKTAQSKNALLAAIVEHTHDAIFSMTCERIITSWNQAAERLYGYTAEEAIGRSGSLIVPPEDDALAHAAFLGVLRGETRSREVVRRRKDGTLVHVSISHAPVRDLAGTIIGGSAIHRDISERHRQEEHMRFVMREMAHRSKNLLAIIISMASQTARGVVSVPDFVLRLTRRLQGLSHSHDLLLAQEWRGAYLRELVARQLAPMIRGEEWRLCIEGPPLFMHPKAAQNLGLALHELATNAIHHGALASPNGRVSIIWAMRDRPDGKQVFHISWSESDVPRADERSHKGFGRLILERLAVQALEGQVRYEDRSDGVSWTLDIPATYVLKPT